jgi:uncharacterized protein YndB with AHSA1/START domain
VAITAHVYQIYVAATPQQVWTAITDSDWTRRYFHGTAFVEPPQQGRPYRTVMDGGRPAVEGEIEEMVPPVDGAPGRFVQTWRVLYDAAMSEEPPSRVEWTVENAGTGLTRVRLVHRDLALSPLTWAGVKDGWVWVLDAMKTLVETGRSLPATRDDSELPTVPTDGDWHRRQGVEANNGVWELVALTDRSPDDDEEMVRRAYAAAYHWQRATGAGPANEARASYMVAKALLLTGQAEASLRSADRCLDVCTRHGLDDFDLAYAHESRARALAALGRADDSARAWDAAVAVPIADPEDREIVDKDFADRPGVAVP